MISRRRLLEVVSTGVVWSIATNAFPQSPSDAAWSVDLDAEAEVLAAGETSDGKAAIVVGSRDRANPAVYASVELIYFGNAQVQKVDLKKMLGQFRAPVRHLALDSDGTVWMVRQPSPESTQRKLSLLALSQGGNQSIWDVDVEWTGDAVITALGVLGSRRIYCGLRNAAGSTLFSLLGDGAPKVKVYGKSAGLYGFFSVNDRTVMAVSGQLADTKSMNVVSTVTLLDENLGQRVTGEIAGWVRGLHVWDETHLSLLTTASLDDDRSFRVDRIEIVQDRFRVVSTETAGGDLVPGSLVLLGGEGDVRVAAVRSVDGSLIVSRAKETATSQPLRKLTTSEELLVRVRWLRSGNKLSLLYERLARDGTAVRKRVSLIPSALIAQILGPR
jgi:hypothetical protein